MALQTSAQRKASDTFPRPTGRRIGTAVRDPNTDRILPGEVNQAGGPMGSSVPQHEMTPESKWREKFPRPTTGPIQPPTLSGPATSPSAGVGGAASSGIRSIFPKVPSAGGAVASGGSAAGGAVNPPVIPPPSFNPATATFPRPQTPIGMGGTEDNQRRLIHPSLNSDGTSDAPVKVAQAGGVGSTPYGPIAVGHTMTPRDGLMTGAPMPTPNAAVAPAVTGATGAAGSIAGAANSIARNFPQLPGPRPVVPPPAASPAAQAGTTVRQGISNIVTGTGNAVLGGLAKARDFTAGATGLSPSTVENIAAAPFGLSPSAVKPIADAAIRNFPRPPAGSWSAPSIAKDIGGAMSGIGDTAKQIGSGASTVANKIAPLVTGPSVPGFPKLPQPAQPPAPDDLADNAPKRKLMNQPAQAY